MSSILSKPPAHNRPLIAASILSADFGRMNEECRDALNAGADLLHLDVMDGHFVPNLTMGPALCGALRRAFPEVCLDVHLMVSEPANFVDAFAEAGASHFTFHIEAEPQPAALAQRIRQTGMTAGLAINPPTNVGAAIPFIEHFDLVLVMSVNPGFAGQRFISGVLEKVRHLRPPLREDQRLQIDGGVNPQTAPLCVSAGCDVLVAASAIFGQPDYQSAIDALRGSKQPAVPKPRGM